MTASDDEALNKRLAALEERLAAQQVTAIDGLTDKTRELIAKVALAGAFDLGQLARKASPVSARPWLHTLATYPNW